ncbi:hypothetical protein HDV01_004641 [Terramyces sp. JEL0728]|nr:hypothetical protein HDV01_004641 [Terramyces sp. JEL0728]
MDWSVKNIIALIADQDTIFDEFLLKKTNTVIVFHCKSQLNYSIISTGYSKIIQIKWDYTGNYLMILDEKLDLGIFKLGETIQNFNMVKQVKLQEFPHKLVWYQPIKQYSPTGLFQQGPDLLFGSYAFISVGQTAISVYFDTMEGEFTCISCSLPVELAMAQALVKENSVSVIGVSSEIIIATVAIDLANQKVSIQHIDKVPYQQPIKFIELSTHHFVTVSDLMDQSLIHVYENSNGWKLVAEKYVSNISCVMAMKNYLFIGYLDGLNEYRMLPSLDVKEMGNILVPDTLPPDDLKDDMQIDVFSNFFSNEPKYPPVDKTQLFKMNYKPVLPILSPNGIHTIQLGVDVFGKSELLVISKEKIKGFALNPGLADKNLNSLAALVVCSALNKHDLLDVSILIRESIKPDLAEKFINSVIIKYEEMQEISSPIPFSKIHTLEEHIEVFQLLFYTTKILQPNSWPLRNSFNILELCLIKDLFCRSLVNQFKALEWTTDFHNKTDLQFQKGAIHHMVPLALWVQDFTSYVKRARLQKYSFINLDGSPLIFALNRNCRRLVLQLLYFVKLFQLNLEAINKQFANITISSSSVEAHSRNAYLQRIDAALKKDRPNLDSMIGIFLEFNSLDALVSDSQPLLRAESILLLQAAVDPHFKPSMDSIKPRFKSMFEKLYQKPEAETLTILINGPKRHLSKIDVITKHNIRSTSKLNRCTRCLQHTQADIELDESFAIFQNMPPWQNAYQDICFCGGHWAPEASQ